MLTHNPHFLSRKSRKTIVLATSICLLLLCLVGSANAVPKTDVLTLVNGNVITCEIKEMTRGQLRAKTDDLGTVSIKWDKIARVVSHYWFLITTKDGTLTYGQMSESNQEGFLTVNFQEKTTTILMSSVVEIQPVRYEFWDRVNVSVSFGLSFSQASDVLQSNFSANLNYQGPIYYWGLDTYAMVTDQGEDIGVTRRNQLDLTLGRELSGRFSGSVSGGSYRNDELGIRMRLTGGLNLGYYFLRTSHLDLKTSAGANVNREWATTDVPPSNNAEGHLGASYSMYYYDSPKTDLTVKLDFYPSITVTDRQRFEANISGRQEIVKDLFIKLEYYESRDTKPPEGANATSDRGILLSLEWTK